MAQKQSFSFQLPLVDRMAQLVNNDCFSDVVFKVGKSGELMYGHKNVLVVASEVFYAQFNGSFAESEDNVSENPVVIPDIEPATFTEVLRFMYCDKANLTKDNVIFVYYASQKYLLKKLEEMCIRFFHDQLNEENVLQLFNTNFTFNFAIINETCLNLISENPLLCFKHEDFFTLEKIALKKIIECEEINCQPKHLEEAIENWLKVNGCEEDTDFSDMLKQSRRYKCRKLYNYGTFSYLPNPITNMIVSVENPLNLFGIGIFVGCKESPNTVDKRASISVRIEKSNQSDSCTMQFVTEERTVILKTSLQIEDFLFEKIQIDSSSKCRIFVKIEEEEANQSSKFCLSQFTPVNPLGDIKIASADVTYDARNNTNRVAYLLYDTCNINKLALD